MNIKENTIIKGMEEIGISRGHLAHCFNNYKLHEKPKYEYFGKIVSRGTIILHTCKGDCLAKFNERYGWIESLEISKLY